MKPPKLTLKRLGLGYILWRTLLLINPDPALILASKGLSLEFPFKDAGYTHTHTHTTVLLLFWNMSGTTWIASANHIQHS